MKMGSGVHVERGHLGVKETVEYLSSLDDHQLVWKSRVPLQMEWWTCQKKVCCSFLLLLTLHGTYLAAL